MSRKQEQKQADGKLSGGGRQRFTFMQKEDQRQGWEEGEVKETKKKRKSVSVNVQIWCILHNCGGRGSLWAEVFVLLCSSLSTSGSGVIAVGAGGDAESF